VCVEHLINDPQCAECLLSIPNVPCVRVDHLINDPQCAECLLSIPSVPCVC